jgi:hypothetical protein
MILSAAETRELTKKILGFSKAESCTVSIEGYDQRHVRYAQNMATTSGAPSGMTVGVESHFGKRAGSATGNDLGDDALRDLVAQSETTARRAPENPEFMPPLGPQTYTAGTGFFPGTQAVSPVQLAAAVRPVLQQAQLKNLQAAGFLQASSEFSSFATSRGLFVHDRNTSVLHTVTARTSDGEGSGWAGATLGDFGRLDAGAMGGTAIDKAVRSHKPARLSPGKYTVILEPSAVADLVSMMLEDFDARAADEGRSFATKRGGGSRLGEKVFGSNITITSDPNDVAVPGAIYSDDGLPAPSLNASCTTWVARDPSDSLMMTEILISLVEIIWMLIPASARARKSVAATPVWERMPMPTTESLLMPSCAVWLLAPIFATCASITFFARGKVVLVDGEGQVGGARERDVLHDHVDVRARFGQGGKEARGHAGFVRHADDGDFGLVFFQADSA